VRSRLFIALVLSLLPVGIGGCDYHNRTYEARGRSVDRAGSPAAGIRLLVSGPLYEPDGSRGYSIKNVADLTSDPDYVAKRSVETDRDGYFRADFIAGDLWSYPMWGSPPEAPVLPEVCLWVFRKEQWIKVVGPLDASAQKEKVWSGREVHVGTVALPPEAAR
jgi:hypothetical protein